MSVRVESPTGLDREEKAGAAQGGSSLARMLEVLDVFTVEESVWGIEGIGEKLGYTPSSTYRYVRELCASGLIASVGGGKYVLGPRIIELDRQISLCDPVERAGREIVPAMIAKVEPGGILICGLRGDHIVSVYSDFRPATLDLSTERGRTSDLFRGAPARAVLAHLPNRKLTRLFLERQDEVTRAGLGERWPEFQKNISAMRRAPYILTRGDFGRPYFALSSPIFDGDDKVVASISLIAPDDVYSPERIEQLSVILLDAAARINARMDAFTAR